MNEWTYFSTIQLQYYFNLWYIFFHFSDDVWHCVLPNGRKSKIVFGLFDVRKNVWRESKILVTIYRRRHSQVTYIFIAKFLHSGLLSFISSLLTLYIIICTENVDCRRFSFQQTNMVANGIAIEMCFYTCAKTDEIWANVKKRTAKKQKKRNGNGKNIYTRSRCPMSCIKYAACCLRSISLSTSIPWLLLGEFCNCSTVKYHFWSLLSPLPLPAI